MGATEERSCGEIPIYDDRCTMGPLNPRIALLFSRTSAALGGKSLKTFN